MPRPAGFRSVVYMGGAGCFLASLVFSNFIFGWLFFKPRIWLLIEIVLIIALWLYTRFMRYKLTRMQQKQDKVIDTDAEIIE
jgi:hypothetical protein